MQDKIEKLSIGYWNCASDILNKLDNIKEMPRFARSWYTYSKEQLRDELLKEDLEYNRDDPQSYYDWSMLAGLHQV